MSSTTETVDARASPHSAAYIIIRLAAFKSRLAENAAQIAATTSKIESDLVLCRLGEENRMLDVLTELEEAALRNKKIAIQSAIIYLDALLLFRRNTVEDFRQWEDAVDFRMVHHELSQSVIEESKKAWDDAEGRLEKRDANVVYEAFATASF